MFSRITLAALPLLALAAPLSAQRAAAVGTEQLRRHIEVLASDAYEGRQPGTPGEAKTLAYISGQFARIGLEPAGPGGRWYQPVPLVQRRAGSHRATFRARGRAVPIGANELILLGRDASERLRAAPVIFVGSGASLPQGLSVRGATVLMLYGAPRGAPPAGERAKRLAAAGAGAVITVYGPEMPWTTLQRLFAEGGDRLQSEARPEISGAMALAAATRLLQAAGAGIGDLPAASVSPNFVPKRLDAQADLVVSTNVREYTSYNVIGRLRGSGRTGESVLYLGHWDHLGICPPVGADRICNGAVDNASGIAMMIEIAATLARGPRPRRDILFMATTAEESGLLGAEHFAARPVVPLKSIVAAINIDTVAIHNRGEPVAVIGRGVAPLDNAIAETAAEVGRRMDTDTEADAFVQRQDGWALARAGVPAVMVGGSFANMAQLAKFISGPYHKADDDLKRPLILDGAAEDTSLLIALGRRLGDPARYRPPTR